MDNPKMLVEVGLGAEPAPTTDPTQEPHSRLTDPLPVTKTEVLLQILAGSVVEPLRAEPAEETLEPGGSGDVLAAGLSVHILEVEHGVYTQVEGLLAQETGEQVLEMVLQIVLLLRPSNHVSETVAAHWTPFLPLLLNITNTY